MVGSPMWCGTPKHDTTSLGLRALEIQQPPRGLVEVPSHHFELAHAMPRRADASLTIFTGVAAGRASGSCWARAASTAPRATSTREVEALLRTCTHT